MTPYSAPSPDASGREPAEIQCQLPRSSRSPQRARALLRHQLVEWGIGCDVSLVAELLISELVTNSLLHARVPAGREIGVRIARYDGLLRVEVSDANAARPELREPTAEDEHGRGLALVQALALRWGCCPRRNGIGKATWAELRLPR
ncbi:ATP-binding protein [Streptomyces sp. NPDC046985]|uniref:ATP-binding protein n=1 Tax=Streptomyces sp. NPDC046985 TaxID=3155377 RepID=UPI0033C0FF19